MTKLSTKKRDDVRALLEDHQAVTDALMNVSKPSYFANMVVMNEKDNDSTDVRFNYNIAKRALTEQKAWTENELKKLGIEIK